MNEWMWKYKAGQETSKKMKRNLENEERKDVKGNVLPHLCICCVRFLIGKQPKTAFSKIEQEKNKKCLE